MKLINKAKVGNKGEILPKKHLRMISNIHPGDTVMIEAKEGEIRIRKIYSVEQAFSLPIISRGIPDEIEEEIITEMNRQDEERSNN